MSSRRSGSPTAQAQAHALADRVVVITGASSGIGSALARRLSAAGCSLVLASRSAPATDLPRTRVVRCDVTRDADVAQLAALVRRDFGGRLDALVNNAGGGACTRPSTLSPLDAHACLEQNYLGAVRVTVALLPALRASGQGHVLNVSSLLAHVPAAAATQRASYAASKAALEAYSAALRAELAAEAEAGGCARVDVSVLVPGATDTAFAAAAAAKRVSFQPASFQIHSPLAGLQAQTADDVAAAIEHTMVTREPHVYTSDAVANAARRAHAQL